MRPFTIMTRSLVSIFLLASLAALAQQGGGIEEGFKQYDKNGDGKVTREEAGQMPMFDQWDLNHDGVVTLEELQAFYAKRGGRGGGTNTPPGGPRTKTEPAPARVAGQDFVPDAPLVGEVNGSYIDPEFSEGANQVVFQDRENRVWIGDLDPETGLFKTATGRDYLVDENITIIFDRPPQGRKFSTNGPEWTRNDKGYCVVYTKEDKTGLMQQWMAQWLNGKSVVTQLTHQKFDCYGNTPSRFEDGKPPRVSFTYDWPIWKAKAAWVFADKPDQPHELEGFDYRQMSMWSAVSPDFLFVKRPQGQVAGANADTGKVTVLTNDEGMKDDPGLFISPEFGGEILLVCNVDNSALGIYRDLKSPDGYWTRVATLALPADAPYKFISSPETIAPATGVGGVSYFSLLARQGKDRNTPGSIWVFGLGKDPANRFVRRVDHGAATGAPTVVLEPEPFVGKKEVFVYYNFYDRASGQHGLRRGATGIKVAAAPPAAPPTTTKPESSSASKQRTTGRSAKYLALICIDACRPDYFEFSDVSSIKKLVSEGVTYDEAWVGQLRNDTPPGHATMATGAFPRNNGIIGFTWKDSRTGKVFRAMSWNNVASGGYNQIIINSGCSSIGTVYKRASHGAKVAAFSSDKWYAAAAFGANSADFIGYCQYSPPQKLGVEVGYSLIPTQVGGPLAPKPEIMNSSDLNRKVVNPWDADTWTMDLALRLFERERPEIILINLSLTDNFGHTTGGITDKETMAKIIGNADRQVGRIMEAYTKAGIYEKTIFVVTADHGMSRNAHIIDETPMAQIIADYGIEKAASRLEFYLRDASKAGEAAEKIARLKLEGIHAVYYKEKNGRGGYHYLPAPAARASLDADLDASYRYLTSTYATPQSADIVLFPAEYWNTREATDYFKGDHGTATWENQHIPLIISGPRIRKGVASRAPARLVDIAPTILAAMGLKPEKMDGVVLADALVSPADELVRLQMAATAQLDPLEDALKRRHDKDAANDKAAGAGGAGSAGPSGARQVPQQTLEMFRRYDRNGDGRVTREEAGNAPWFARVDRNGDGAITLDELGQPAPGATQAPPAGARKSGPTSAGKPQPLGMKRAFTFTRDYTAGTKDSKGRMRTGQELMRIVAYRGELFAATSTFTDPRLYIPNDPDYTGCQVLRKLSSKSEWQVDASFGKRYLRTDCLEVIRFTRDANGKALPKPTEMLVAGIWDLGRIVQDAIVTARDRHLTLAVRNDTTGEWTLIQGPSVPDTELGFACIRAMKLHRDRVTGMEYLFIAAGCGGMYKSVYDPSVPGRIRWLEGDELDTSYGRGQSMCEANGDLYVSYDYGGLLVQDQKGGVFRRIDGRNSTWERVYRNYDPQYRTWNQTGRGITAVPAEDGSAKEVILVGIEWPPEPIIVRIEPHKGHRAVTELNYHEYFTKVFGREPQIQGGSAQYPHAGCEIPALNYFEPFLSPETGKTERFVTLFLFHPDDPAEGCNNAYFLIRRGPGAYDWGEVTSDLPTGESMRGVRTIQKSPFPDEPNTYYFGGFFTGPDVQPPRPNLAWIFKGGVGKREQGTVKTAPPTKAVAPALYENTDYGFSFRYPGNMVRTRSNVMAMPDVKEPPTILVEAVAARPVKEAVAQSFRKAYGIQELKSYTETDLYLGSSTGVAGNLRPGGRIGKMFTLDYLAGKGRPASSALGMAWTQGNHTMVIAVSYWGDYTEATARVLLNSIIVSLKIDSSPSRE